MPCSSFSPSKVIRSNFYRHFVPTARSNHAGREQREPLRHTARPPQCRYRSPRCARVFLFPKTPRSLSNRLLVLVAQQTICQCQLFRTRKPERLFGDVFQCGGHALMLPERAKRSNESGVAHLRLTRYHLLFTDCHDGAFSRSKRSDSRASRAS